MLMSEWRKIYCWIQGLTVSNFNNFCCGCDRYGVSRLVCQTLIHFERVGLSLIECDAMLCHQLGKSRITALRAHNFVLIIVKLCIEDHCRVVFDATV